MRVHATGLDGVLVIEPDVFVDRRGCVFESYNQLEFATVAGVSVPFVLDLRTRSEHGVLRGIHYQILRPQGKLVCALAGRIFDVAVDLRRSSRTFGQWFGVELSGDNKRQIWVPAGFGHAFLTLSPIAEVLYKLSDYHSAEHSRTIAWNDANVAIDWPLPADCNVPILSEQDCQGVAFRDAEVFG